MWSVLLLLLSSSSLSSSSLSSSSLSLSPITILNQCHLHFQQFCLVFFFLIKLMIYMYFSQIEKGYNLNMLFVLILFRIKEMPKSV